jgi:membrane-associated phospholipid phosphatase
VGLDVALGASGASVVLGGLLLRTLTSPPPLPLDAARVFAPDRMLMAPYAHAPDLASDLALAACIALPAVCLIGSDPGDAATLVAMYAETMALAQGLKEIMKATLPRYRPYMYQQDPPAELLGDKDRFASFPSGHTTMVFASAAYLASVFAAYHANSRLTVPLVAGGIALAGVTAGLRIAAGQHFVTDVLVGAALGSLCGVVVPLLHKIPGRTLEVPSAQHTAIRTSR